MLSLYIQFLTLCQALFEHPQRAKDKDVFPLGSKNP